MSIQIPSQILPTIEEADHKVLATVGKDGPNVVPLSMVAVDGGKIIVCDCFMDKSVKNLQLEDRVALAFWKNFAGVQIKGRVAYETEGKYFDRYTDWLKEKHADRTLRGVLVVSVESIYDLAPQNAGTKIA